MKINVIQRIKSSIDEGDISDLKHVLKLAKKGGYDLNALENRPVIDTATGAKETWLIYSLSGANRAATLAVLLAYRQLDVMGIGSKGRSFFAEYLSSGNLSSKNVGLMLNQINTLIPKEDFDFLPEAMYFDGRRLEIYNLILEHNSKHGGDPFAKVEEGFLRGKLKSKSKPALANSFVNTLPAAAAAAAAAAAPQNTEYNFAAGYQQQPTFMLPTYPSPQYAYPQQQTSSSSSSAVQFNTAYIPEAASILLSMQQPTPSTQSFTLQASNFNVDADISFMFNYSQGGRTSAFSLNKTTKSSSSAGIEKIEKIEKIENLKQALEVRKRLGAAARAAMAKHEALTGLTYKPQDSDEEWHALHIPGIPRLPEPKVGPRLFWQFDKKDRDPEIELRSDFCVTDIPLKNVRVAVEICLSNMTTSMPKAMFGMMKTCLSEIEAPQAIDATQLIMQAYKILEQKQYHAKTEAGLDKVAALVNNLINFIEQPNVVGLYKDTPATIKQIKKLIAELPQKSKPEVRPAKRLKRTYSPAAAAAAPVVPETVPEVSRSRSGRVIKAPTAFVPNFEAASKGYSFKRCKTYAELADMREEDLPNTDNSVVEVCESDKFRDYTPNEVAEIIKNAIDPNDLPKCRV